MNNLKDTVALRSHETGYIDSVLIPDFLFCDARGRVKSYMIWFKSIAALIFPSIVCWVNIGRFLVIVVVVVCVPLIWGCVWARLPFGFLLCTLCAASFTPPSVGICVCHICISGSLDFRLVIQVLFGPRMFLNACARRPDLGLTSHPKDVALPQG